MYIIYIPLEMSSLCSMSNGLQVFESSSNVFLENLQSFLISVHFALHPPKQLSELYSGWVISAYRKNFSGLAEVITDLSQHILSDFEVFYLFEIVKPMQWVIYNNSVKISGFNRMIQIGLFCQPIKNLSVFPFQTFYTVVLLQQDVFQHQYMPVDVFVIVA